MVVGPIGVLVVVSVAAATLKHVHVLIQCLPMVALIVQVLPFKHVTLVLVLQVSATSVLLVSFLDVNICCFVTR
jgi:hypothetical protein